MSRAEDVEIYPSLFDLSDEDLISPDPADIANIVSAQTRKANSPHLSSGARLLAREEVIAAILLTTGRWIRAA